MKTLLAVIRPLGVIGMVMSLSHLVPIAVSLYYGDGAVRALCVSMLFNFTVSLIAFFAARGLKIELKARDGMLLVALAWTGGAAFATLPLLMMIPGLSFTDAYFEAVSGLTTTGSTVLSNLDTLAPSLNIWRGLLVWLGGMGLIVLAVAVLPLLGVGGRQMFKAETPGPMKDSQLTPRITETAKALWEVYALISLLCFLAYHFAGMSWFDALMHMFSTMGLGGFSSHDASFGHFNSLAIEIVAIVFMLLAGINFGTHFVALRGRSFGAYRRDSEAHAYLLITLASCAGIAAFLYAKGTYASFGEALRFASFNVISVATTTGFSNTDYNQWPLFAPLWMLFLCCFASCSGSTGGGIKMVRAILLYKQVNREYNKLLHPRAVAPAKIGGQVIENKIIFAVLAFMFVYVSSVVAMTLVMVASGLDLTTALSAVVACINNTGPGLDKVGPATTYAVLTDFQTWVCTFAMLLGRLELFTLLIIFTSAFWRR